MAKKKDTYQSMERPEDSRHESLVKHCLDLYNKFKKSEYRQAKLTQIEEARKTYEQKEEKATFPWPDASNKILPFETITVDNLEPRLIAGLTGTDPIIAFAEQSAELDDEGQLIEDWYNNELKTVVKVEEIARNIVHTILLEGTRFSMVQYREDTIKKKDFQYDEQGKMLVDDDGAPKMVEIDDLAYEGGKDEFIPFSNMYIADDVSTEEQWQDADKIREVDYTYAELKGKKDKPGYRNIGPWLLSGKTQEKLKEEDKSPAQLVAGVDITGKEKIRCIECHISYAINNLEEEDPQKREQFDEERVIITVAVETKLCIRKILQRDINMNNKTVLRRVRLFPEEGLSYGTPIHGKIKSIQEGASDTFNRMMNIADIIYLPWYFYEEGAGVKGKHAIQPGEGIPIEDVSKIKFPEFRINPKDYIAFIDLFINLWERTVSLSEPGMGKPSSEKKTATEVLAVIQEGYMKHNYHAKTSKEEFLFILKTMFDLYYQHMPYEMTVNYAGQDIPFPREQMRRPWNFRLTGSTEKANKLIERKENEDMFNMLGNDPYMQPIALREDMLKSYNREDTKRYINPQANEILNLFLSFPQEVLQALQPLVEQIQAMKQEQGGGQGQ